MYRRMKHLTTRALDYVTAAVATLFEDVYKQAQRENRQRDRGIERAIRHKFYRWEGLNGPRALARRRRQIVNGQLTFANGLVE